MTSDSPTCDYPRSEGNARCRNRVPREGMRCPWHPRTPDEDSEFRCAECGNRCTRGPSGREYGHRRRPRCSRRPHEVDPKEETTPGRW